MINVTTKKWTEKSGFATWCHHCTKKLEGFPRGASLLEQIWLQSSQEMPDMGKKHVPTP